MRQAMLHGVFVGVLAFAAWVAPAAAQNTASPAALTAQIEAKRMEIRHHTQLIQGIQDPALLQRETLKHFLMTEEMLALVLEQQKQMLQAASAPATGAMGGMEGEHAMEMPGAAPSAGATAPMGGGMMDDDAMEMPSAPTPGGPPAGATAPMGGGMMGDDAMEMPSAPTPGGPPAGATAPMGGGMMGDDAMEMPSAPTPGGPPAGATAPMGGGMMGGMRGGHEMMGMGGMKGGAAPDPVSMTGASAAARQIAEREALLKEIDTHSAYLATISDPAIRAREIVKHQEMLDRLVATMR